MKHSDFDLRWPSSEPRRLLLQLPLRTSRQLLRSSMIKRSPRFALRYVQSHWKETLNRWLPLHLSSMSALPNVLTPRTA
jgi:hypothetical protein